MFKGKFEFKAIQVYILGTLFQKKRMPGMVAQAFSPSTWWAKVGGFYEFKLDLIYRVSYRLARATQKKKRKKRTGKEKQKTPHLPLSTSV